MVWWSRLQQGIRKFFFFSSSQIIIKSGVSNDRFHDTSRRQSSLIHFTTINDFPLSGSTIFASMLGDTNPAVPYYPLRIHRGIQAVLIAVLTSLFMWEMDLKWTWVV